jgi:hypothetical protein
MQKVQNDFIGGFSTIDYLEKPSKIIMRGKEYR